MGRFDASDASRESRAVSHVRKPGTGERVTKVRKDGSAAASEAAACLISSPPKRRKTRCDVKPSYEAAAA